MFSQETLDMLVGTIALDEIAILKYMKQLTQFWKIHQGNCIRLSCSKRKEILEKSRNYKKANKKIFSIDGVDQKQAGR